MREPRKFIGGVMQRFDDETDEQWEAAQRRHALDLDWLAASKVREHVYELMGSVIREPGDTLRMDVIVSVGRVVLETLPEGVDTERQRALKAWLDKLSKAPD